jgi:hypothetical protein
MMPSKRYRVPEMPMLKYVYPGVYVEEYDSQPTSISSVLSADMGSLASELRDIVQRIQPDWTDRNPSDPAITLLEVLAWLSETLHFRCAAFPEQGRRVAMRAVATLSAIAGSCSPASGTISRPNFYAGQILDAEILQAEQDYHREKQRRHNLALHGFGIVEGLEVRVETTADAPVDRVHVDPGYAISRCGEGITLGQRVVLALPQTPQEIYVSLRHDDIPCGPVSSAAGEPTFSRVEEACVLALVDTVAEPALALAHLLRSEGRWAIDRSFVPLRLSRI